MYYVCIYIYIYIYTHRERDRERESGENLCTTHPEGGERLKLHEDSLYVVICQGNLG